MALIPGWLPPTRENWELIVWSFQFFPILVSWQWFTDYLPMGKTSQESRFNVPGKPAWLLMELPAPLIMIYTMVTLPPSLNLPSLPWANWTLATLYTVHYVYRAIIMPLMTPSMSPMHIAAPMGAVWFNYMNATSLACWLGGYGPTTNEEWAGRLYWMEVGLVIWGWSFLGNIFHDDDLREIRRSASRRQAEKAKKERKPVEGVEKLYMMPKNGLFHFILYPHYVCEWMEWFGFWMVAGWGCVPARTFLINEISTMLPRAVQGKRWYLERFGKERVGGRTAVIPGLL